MSSSDLSGSTSGHSEHQPVRESGPGAGQWYQPTGDLKADNNFETVDDTLSVTHGFWDFSSTVLTLIFQVVSRVVLCVFLLFSRLFLFHFNIKFVGGFKGGACDGLDQTAH